MDNDTLDVKKFGVEVFIVVKTDTINFLTENKLKYPIIEKNEDVKSIIVRFKEHNYTFFDKAQSTLPKELISTMGPFYIDLFNDKRNMYITVSKGTKIYEDFPAELMTKETMEQLNKRHISIYYQVKTSIVID
jgi:hypothetical protein